MKAIEKEKLWEEYQKESHAQATGTAHNRICTAGQACGRTPQHVSWA